jgi:hypothetical protein
MTESLQIQGELPAERDEAFDAIVEEIRRQYLASSLDVVSVLGDRLRRSLGLAPTSMGHLTLTGLIGICIRLIVVLLVTAIAGRWTGIPWGRWTVVVVLFGLMDAGTPLMAPHPDAPLGSRIRRIIEDWTPLVPTIVRESDLRDLARFTRRWIRMPVGTGLGMVVATLMLGASWLVAPTGMSELPAGTIVLLAWLLYEFGVNVVFWGNLVNWAFIARESRYDHHLFWPSPADSPEVRKALSKTTSQGSAAGLWITFYLVLSVFLVSWDSPVVLPLAVGFVVFGYLAAIGQAVSSRASVRKIVERIRRQRLQGIERRIDTFGPQYTDLSPEQSAQLRDLLFLHDRIRDAPASPAAKHAIARTVAGLLPPTIAFVITVFGEVSAERLLDAILP